jgi:hypothetical protein
MQSFKTFKPIILKEVSSLGGGELMKDKSGGGPRLAILRDLIARNIPLELVKGGTFVVTDKERAELALQKYEKDQKVFVLIGGDDGKTEVKNTQLAKSAVFGGGSGGNNASYVTKLTESHQCVFCDAMLTHGTQHNIDWFNAEVLAKSYKKVDVDASLKEILTIEGDWVQSAYNIAKALIDKGYIKKGMVFHRNSAAMKRIYALKDLAYANSDMKSLKDDKWNPGDIWAIEDGRTPDNLLNTQNVRGLNISILDGFSKQRIVGISLKKAVKSVSIKEFNIDIPPDVDDHVLKSFDLQSKGGTFFSAKNSTIVFDDGTATVKDGTPFGSLSLSILLKGSRGGSGGWAVMRDASELIFRKSIMPKSYASGVSKVGKKIESEYKKGKPGKNAEIFWKLFKATPDGKNFTRDQFDENMKAVKGDFMAAKLGSLYIYHDIMIINKSTKKTNRWITKVINYAGSKSEDASAYIKCLEG